MSHDDLQKKHFGRHPKEEGKSTDSQYFSDRKKNSSVKRHPTTIKKGKGL